MGVEARVAVAAGTVVVARVVGMGESVAAATGSTVGSGVLTGVAAVPVEATGRPSRTTASAAASNMQTPRIMALPFVIEIDPSTCVSPPLV